MRTSPNLSDIRDIEHPHVVMTIGIPGSGKSYLINQIGDALGYPVLSSDAIREELSGDPADQTVSKEAWRVLFERTKQHIQNEQSLCIDGTNTVRDRRISDIDRFRAFGATAVIGIYIQSSLETALKRNSSRDRVVPENVIKIMHRRLSTSPPTTNDGFDFVVTLDNN